MIENLSKYAANPQLLNRDTLYELRMIVGKYPYFDAARILLLKNLYLLHEIEFGQELRKAALYLKNRVVLFELMENYGNRQPATTPTAEDMPIDRTISLIDAFLETLPQDKLSLEAEGAAAIDYVSTYLNEKEPIAEVPKLRGQDLIDDFLSGSNEKITLNLQPPTTTEDTTPAEESLNNENSFFTETLANIYVKQGKYDKALEIIKRLNLEYPNKNRYFADQIRFLEKIIKHTKNK